MRRSSDHCAGRSGRRECRRSRWTCTDDHERENPFSDPDKSGASRTAGTDWSHRGAVCSWAPHRILQVPQSDHTFPNQEEDEEEVSSCADLLPGGDGRTRALREVLGMATPEIKPHDHVSTGNIDWLVTRGIELRPVIDGFLKMID